MILVITLNQVVAILGVAIGMAAYVLIHKLGYPPKLAVGAAALTVLVVAIFWSAVSLGNNDEDEEDEE